MVSQRENWLSQIDIIDHDAFFEKVFDKSENAPSAECQYAAHQQKGSATNHP